MEDNELRQALAAMEVYKERVEALSQQVQVLRVSLQEVSLASDAMKAFKDAKEGDEILVPVGASCFVTVKVTSNRNVLVGIGSEISVEKEPADAVDYMEANAAEISEALKKSAEALSEAQSNLANLSNAIQQEYAARQQAQNMA